MKRVEYKVGDVFQINLPNGKYAYGRIYDDAAVGFYKEITDEPLKPPIGSRDFAFIVGFNDKVITSGECPIVGYDGFSKSESAWPPPTFIKDPISGKYSIYHKGKIRKASEEECDGLEETAVWHLSHVIERLMKQHNKSQRRR